MQTKVEDSISKLQGGLQQSKERLRQSQEFKKLSQEVQASTVKKGELLFQMGEKLYGEIRSGETEIEKYEKWVSQIIQEDKLIHNRNEEIRKLQNANGNQVCECGTIIHDEDKFCGGCGKEIVHKKEFLEEDLFSCSSCETEIPRESNFCKCCGVKVTVV